MPIIVYYRNFDFNDKCSIYQSYMPDYLRVIISRWRLSSHSLRIETGRYENILDRNDRVCKLCNVCEDEHYVIFICPAYKELGHTYKKLLRTISAGSSEDANDTANFLLGLEGIRKKLSLTV